MELKLKKNPTKQQMVERKNENLLQECVGTCGYTQVKMHKNNVHFCSVSLEILTILLIQLCD